MLATPGPGSAARLRRWRIVDALIVIILLFVLAGLLFRVLSPRHPHLPPNVALRNTKNLILGVLMYAQDYDGYLPSAASWPDQIDPYVRNRTLYKADADPTGQPVSYAMAARYSGVNLADIANRESAVVLYEAEYGRPAAWHNGGLHVAFADGHAKWYPSLPEDPMQSPGGKDNPVTDRNPHQ